MGSWSSLRETTVLRRGREEGQDLVEFALIAPIVFLDTERLAIARDTAVDYAQSVMVSGVAATSSFGEYLITDEETGLSKSLPTIMVHVSFDHLSATGLFGPLHMEASSTMLVE